MQTNAVLVISGLDPSGAAGMAADIESINQFGVVPLPLVSALTVQNTQKVESINEVDDQILIEQFDSLLDDINFFVIKIGMLCSAKQIHAVSRIISQTKQPFVILDPILKASTNDLLLEKSAINVLKDELLPKVDLLTPNASELITLSANSNEKEAIGLIPCRYVLVTNTDTSDKKIEHRLYHNKKLINRFEYQKLPGDYHGSGCTLSSSISALVAKGLSVHEACDKALEYTYQTLLNAKSLGKMQYHPNRVKPS